MKRPLAWIVLTAAITAAVGSATASTGDGPKASPDLTTFVGAPDAAVVKAFGSPARRVKTVQAGVLVALKLVYPKLHLTLELKPQGSPALTVARVTVNGGQLRVGGIRVGMTRAQVALLVRGSGACTRSACRLMTIAGRAAAVLRRSRVTSVFVSAPHTPVPRGQPTTGKTELPATTRVVPGAEVQSAFGPADGTQTIVLGPGTAASLAPGDVLAIGVTPATPNGLLGTVTSTGVRGNKMTVETTPAALTDAIPTGDLNVCADLTDSGLQSQSNCDLARAAPSRRRGSATGFSTGISKTLGCGNAGIKVDGSADITPSFAFSAHWGGLFHPSVQQATFKVSATESVNLSVTGGVGASCSLVSANLFSRTFSPFTVWVGPVPVVLVPKLDLQVKANATLDANLAASVRQQLTVAGGVTYDHGSFSAIHTLSNSFIYQQPSPDLSASLGAGVTGTLTLLVYGVLGPDVSITPSLNLEVDPLATDPTPWWKLTGRLDAGAGLSVPALRLTWSKPDLITYQKTLASETKPAPPPPPPPPPPPTGTRTIRIDWNTDQTDIDLHIWDTFGDEAWYRDRLGIPNGALSEDIMYGYGPEIFTTSDGPTPLAIGVCYFTSNTDDGSIPPTDVTITITEADGSERVDHVSLADKGDEQIVDVSPQGSSTFSPDPGWCYDDNGGTPP